MGYPIRSAHQVLAGTRPIAHHLARVKARMVDQNFPPDDKLGSLRKCTQAHDLALKVHKLGAADCRMKGE